MTDTPKERLDKIADAINDIAIMVAEVTAKEVGSPEDSTYKVAVSQLLRLADDIEEISQGESNNA